jgi:tetratricopeptide (TPR) repeat protein
MMSLRSQNQYSETRRWAALSISVLASLAFSAARAEDNLSGTATEQRLMPEYCRYTHPTELYIKGTGTLSEGGKRWIAINGEGNQKHIHHFCWAMVRLIRSHGAGATAQVRKHLRETAIGDIDYSIENSTAGFRLLPELWTKRGTTLTLLNRDAEAMKSFQNALAASPKYVPAYVELADLLRRKGDLAGARATLKSGIETIPEAAVLKTQLAELDKK